MLLIAFSWLIPIIMTAVAVATWNCAFLCKCPSNNYEGEHCPHDKGCSRMWAPLTTGFLLMNVSLWAVQVRKSGMVHGVARIVVFKSRII